jgi:hypothetical protein
VKFLFVSWTAYQPKIGTIGMLERELHAFSTALSRAGHDVTILTGTLPGRVRNSNHLVDGVRIRRIPELSPTIVPWLPKRIGIDVDQIRFMKEQFRPHVTRYLNETGPGLTTFVGMGEVDVQRAMAIAELIKEDDREHLVNMPVTHHNDIRLFKKIPFSLHIFNAEYDRLRTREQEIAESPFLLAPIAPDLMLFRPDEAEPDEPEKVHELLSLEPGASWVYLPQLADTDLQDHARAIRAVGAAQRQAHRPLAAAIARPSRVANPKRAKDRLDFVRDIADFEKIALHVFEPVEPIQMAGLVRQATFIVASQNALTTAEGNAVGTPVLTTRTSTGIRSVHSLTTELTKAFSEMKAQRERLKTRAEGRRRLLDKHAPDRHERLVRAYEHLIEPKPRAPSLPASGSRQTSLDRVNKHPSRSKTLGVQLNTSMPAPFPEAKIDRVIVSTIGPESRLDAAAQIAEQLGGQLVVMCSSKWDMQDFASALELRGLSGALLINASQFENSPLNAAHALRGHPIAGDYKADVAAKRNLTKVLFPGERVLLLDDDVTFEDQANHARNAAKWVGPGAFHAVGIPVIEEGDHSTVHHSSTLFGLDEPDAFVGAGCEVVHVDAMRLYPAIYGEDWMALLDSIGEEKLALLGDARQTPGWPLADPRRARNEAWGDFVTNAAMEWLAREKEAGRLRKRSWTEMDTDFLNDFRHQWIIGLGQLHAHGVQTMKDRPREAYRFTKALESLDQQIARINELDVTQVVDYVQKYAVASDHFEQHVSQLDVAATPEQRLESLGIDHHVTTSSRVVEASGDWAPPDATGWRCSMLSDLWLETIRPDQLTQSLSHALSGDRLKAGEDKTAAINFALWSRRKHRAAAIRPESSTSHPVESVVRWLATSPLIEQHLHGYMSSTHREKCESIIDELHVSKRQKALLRRALSATAVLGLSANLAKHRMDQLQLQDSHHMSTEEFGEFLEDAFFKPHHSIPALETSINESQSAFNELKHVFQNFFGAKRNDHFAGAELNAVAFFRLAVTPVADPEGRQWQEIHRHELLAGISGADWQQLADRINADNRSGVLGSSLSEIWADDWVRQTSAGRFRTSDWSAPLQRSIAAS